MMNALIPIPLLLLALNVADRDLSLGLFAAAQVFAALWLGAGSSTVQDLVLPHMRARASAVFLLFVTVVGLALGPYAVGRLALVVSKDSGFDPKGFGELLKSPGIRRIAIANPAHAPYGRAAEAALQTWRVRDLVATKLVLGDSVSQAAQFVDAGAAQAGIVALSLARSGTSRLAFTEIPEAVHPPLDQAGVILKRTAALDAARAFQAYLTGEAGRTVLSRYGFGLPNR